MKDILLVLAFAECDTTSAAFCMRNVTLTKLFKKNGNLLFAAEEFNSPSATYKKIIEQASSSGRSHFVNIDSETINLAVYLSWLVFSKGSRHFTPQMLDNIWSAVCCVCCAVFILEEPLRGLGKIPTQIR
ncbi:hypothetical protein J6590_035027 [Homalodisca vitripennis]|nr:hypothetical protein J6590_035027 [Homalodisca vitripennis]